MGRILGVVGPRLGLMELLVQGQEGSGSPQGLAVQTQKRRGEMQVFDIGLGVEGVLSPRKG